MVLGALLGAQTGSSRIPPALKDGLHKAEAIEQEIVAFVRARVPSKTGSTHKEL